VPALAEAIAAGGGRALIVGGWLRDQLLARPSPDIDLEVFGLTAPSVQSILDRFGFAKRVGRQFPVWRLPRREIDVALPRGAEAELRPTDPESLMATFREAARHRDLTINAIGWDPLDGRWLDPWQGRRDLEARALRAVDGATFAEDPLRGLRVARLGATLEATPDGALLDLCRGLDLAGLPVERVAGELRRMLLEPAWPSRAFRLLDEMDLLSEFPPIAALRGVPQDPRWHPEGDVFVHTCLALDCAARIVGDLGREERERLLLSTLCHDLGKPRTTRRQDQRVRALGHEALGARLAREWLTRLRLPNRLVESVAVLVAHHLAPVQLIRQRAGPRAYRKLARKLESAGVCAVDLERLARADHLGRTTDDARHGRFAAGDAFLVAAEAAHVRSHARPRSVTARHLMARGLAPGPELGRALARCLRVQDERGWSDPDRIADLVVGRGHDRRDPAERDGPEESA